MEDNYDITDNTEQGILNFSNSVDDTLFDIHAEADAAVCGDVEKDLLEEQNRMETSFDDLAQSILDTNPTYADNFGNTHDSCLEHDNSYDDLAKIKQDLDDEIDVSDKELDELHNRADGIEREEHHDGISFKGVKICATRHGCSGATNCDYEYGAPVGR